LLAYLGHEGVDVGLRHEFPARPPQVVGPVHRPGARAEGGVEREGCRGDRGPKPNI
jgi:hypothetical protein